MKKLGRRKYLEDYKMVGGEIVYTGDWFVFSGSAQERTRHNRAMTASAAAAVLAAVVPGLMHIRGMDTPYVLVPYVLQLITAVLCLADVCKVWYAGERLSREQYERGVQRTRISGIVLLAAGAAAALGQAAFLAFADAWQSLAPELVFLLCAAVCAAMGYYMHRRLRKVRWEKTK